MMELISFFVHDRLAHISLAIMNILDIALVARSNIQLGIPDEYMVLGGSAVSDAINQFKYVIYIYFLHLPLLLYSGPFFMQNRSNLGFVVMIWGFCGFETRI